MSTHAGRPGKDNGHGDLYFCILLVILSLFVSVCYTFVFIVFLNLKVCPTLTFFETGGSPNLPLAGALLGALQKKEWDFKNNVIVIITIMFG